MRAGIWGNMDVEGHDVLILTPEEVGDYSNNAHVHVVADSCELYLLQSPPGTYSARAPDAKGRFQKLAKEYLPNASFGLQIPLWRGRARPIYPPWMGIANFTQSLPSIYDTG